MQGAGNKMEAAKYRDKLDDYWAKREKEEVSIQDFFLDLKWCLMWAFNQDDFIARWIALH